MADRIEDYAVNSARWLSLEDFEGEVWKDIPGYEGWYQVSNMGRIKSLDRTILLKRPCDSVSRTIYLKGKIIKACTSRGCYLICHLKKNGTVKTVKYHRVVCSVFRDNPCNLPEVNHINEIKTDNRAENLEFCTRIYNARWGTAIQRASEKTRNHPNTSRPVFQFTKDGIFVKRYPSVKQACRETGLKDTNINSVCRNGHSATAGGFIWSFSGKKSDIDAKVRRKKENEAIYCKKAVIMFSPDGEYIREFGSIAEAQFATGIHKDTISRCCRHEGYYKTAGGYKWEFK